MWIPHAMIEDFILTEMPRAFERRQHRLTRLDVESVGYAQNNGRQRSMSLCVALTGYRLLTTIVIVGIGIPKAVYSYHGQSLISPSLDWVGGVIVTILLFWLGVIEATRSELCPSFFQYDWGPDILRILRRVNNPRSLLGSVSRRPTPLIPQRSPTDSTLLPVTQRAETAPVPLRPNTTSPIPNYDESHPEIVMQEGPQPVTYSGWSHDDSEDRQHGSSSINDMYIGDSSEETGYSSSYMLASGPTSHFDDFDFGPRGPPMWPELTQGRRSQAAPCLPCRLCGGPTPLYLLERLGGYCSDRHRRRWL